ncbi:MAG: hypothetical protein ACXU8A_04265 [Burkholderiaceae bacterium]
MKAAEEFSAQFEYLNSFIKDDVTQADRTKMVENVGKAFFKIQMVANEDTIKAAAEAIKEWAIASNKIVFIGLIPEGATSIETGINKLERLIEIQKISLPFLKKFWQFIITARAEMKSASPFANNDKYIEYMETKQRELIEFIESSIVGIKGLN